MEQNLGQNEEDVGTITTVRQASDLEFVCARYVESKKQTKRQNQWWTHATWQPAIGC